MSMWCDLLESYSCNGSYSLIAPETIGALTDAPIITDAVDYSDDQGDVSVYPDSKIWWYPDYMVVNEFEKLLDDRFIIFTKA